MEYQQTVLPSGLTVISVKMPGREGSCVAAFVNAATRNETEANGGIAHFGEHMAFKGTSNRSAHRIAAEIENLGSQINAYTSLDLTCYYVMGLRKHLSRAVAILGDVLTHSLYRPEDIDVERGPILQEISQYEDDPGSVAGDAFSELFFPGQAIGRPTLGTREFVSSVKRADFLDFLGRNYYGANMVVVGVGDFPHADLAQQVEEAFADLPHQPVAATTREAVRYGSGQVSKGGRFEQVSMVVGYPCPGRGQPGWRAAQRLAIALGGSMSSPLFQEIREKRGMVYHVSAHADIGDDHGAFLIQAGTDGDTLASLMQVLGGEMKRVVDHGVQTEDFERATNMVLVGAVDREESAGNLAQHIGRSFFLNRSPLSRLEERRQIQSVVPEDLQQAARTIFAQDPAIAMAGPALQADYLDMLRRSLA